MRRNWDRLAAWCGIGFVVLVGLAAVSYGNRPDAHATGSAVIRFYVQHRGSQHLADVLVTLGFAALVFFAVVLRGHLRTYGRDSLAVVVVAGAVVLAAGEALDAGFDWALADRPSALSASTASALNLGVNDVVLMSAVGWFMFSVGAGVAIVRGAGLPTWLGWTSVLIGVLALTPLEFLAFFLLLAWVVVTTVVVWQRWPSQPYVGETVEAAPILRS